MRSCRSEKINSERDNPPDLGAPTTPIVLTFSRLTSSVSPEVQIYSFTTSHSETEYVSAALGTIKSRDILEALVLCCGIDDLSYVAEFLPGDTVTFSVAFLGHYETDVAESALATFAETYRLRARVSVPTPVPESSQTAQLGAGFLLLLGLSRIRPGRGHVQP